MESEMIMKKINHLIGWIIKGVLLVIFGWPFFWLISTSLQTVAEVNTITPTFIPAVPQFNNYIKAWNFGSAGMSGFLQNSILIILAVIVLQTLVMVPAAYAFAKYEFRLKKVMFGCILAAFMLPTQITFLPVYLMMSDWKLINTLWPQILPFMTNAFAIFLLRQYFMQIPDELIDAARIDGATEARIICQLMVPMSKPAFATIMLFSFVGHWNDYFWPFVMTNSDITRTLPVAIAQMKDLEGLANWNVIMAGNAILVLPILIIYFVAHKQIVKSFAYSGIK
jgi:sn-glycerol 3-phosphate transport system permease protein